MAVSMEVSGAFDRGVAEIHSQEVVGCEMKGPRGNEEEQKGGSSEEGRCCQQRELSRKGSLQIQESQVLLKS